MAYVLYDPKLLEKIKMVQSSLCVILANSYDFKLYLGLEVSITTDGTVKLLMY